MDEDSKLIVSDLLEPSGGIGSDGLSISRKWREDARRLEVASSISPAHFCDEMRKPMERDALRRSALAYDSDPDVQRRRRLAEIEDLRRRSR